MTETIDARHTSRLAGDMAWNGYLTLANYEAVAARLRRMLDGHAYTWVASNEGLWSYRPEVRTGMRAEKIEAKLLAPDHGHLMVCDTYGVWGLSAHLPSQAAGHALAHDEAMKRGPYVAFKRDRYGDQLHIEHFAPVGARLYWVIAVEPDPTEGE